MEFIEAAQAADEKNLQSMLANDPGLRDQHADLIPRFAEERNWAAVRLLAGLGFEVNGATSDGATPLHHVAAAGELATAKVLIEHGADPNAQESQYGARPAGWAQYHHKREMQEYLESLAG